jgi:hypothetical protein
LVGSWFFNWAVSKVRNSFIFESLAPAPIWVVEAVFARALSDAAAVTGVVLLLIARLPFSVSGENVN